MIPVIEKPKKEGRIGPPKVQHSTGGWNTYAAAIKTSAVVSLSLCKLIGDLLLSSGEVFQIHHLNQLLTALESQYWCARLFDCDEALRSGLRQRGFIVIIPGPHLLDQEVSSAKIMLRTIIDIYLSTENEDFSSKSSKKLDLFVTPWISR